MIEKKRLEELIEQGATIWSNAWEEEIVLDKDHCVIFYCTRYNNEYDCDILSVDEGDGYVNNYIIRELEEDVESAKWKLEFGNIERTEKLTLPTWEEFCKEPDLEFYGIKDNRYNIYSDSKWLRLSQVFDDEFEWYVDLFCKEATKENYLEACRLAKKLFMGEKVEGESK